MLMLEMFTKTILKKNPFKPTLVLLLLVTFNKSSITIVAQYSVLSIWVQVK